MNEELAPNKLLDSDPWAILLTTVKKIKDAVHKSIMLTELETKIIDSEQFQRLRHIKQTGPAYLLYPTALHTRFDHSIGTLHVAQLMVSSINKSERIPLLSGRDVFIIRLVALLHDLVHLPFGHTLEDEGRLFTSKQWQSKIRQGKFFEPVAEIIREGVISSFTRCGKENEGKLQSKLVVEQIRQTLIAEEDGNVEGLDAPYVADIVGNTICADLLDYVSRDVFFCGLSGGYDELIFFYMTLKEIPNKKGELKKRLVIRLFKQGKKEIEIRPDVLTALVDLLRLRYSIGERVYYHHTKREASAMLVKMVAAGMEAGLVTEEMLCEHSDDSLLYFVRKFEKDEALEEAQLPLDVAQKLEKCFSGRKLYKPVYKLSIVDYSQSDKINELINDWKKRYDTEEKLCELVGLEHGDILIYVPSERMGAKQADALVQVPFKFDGGADICTLNQLANKRVKDANLQDIVDVLKAELEALENKHRVLWKLSVFVHPRIKETPQAAELSTLCEQWFNNKAQFELVHRLSEKQGIQLNSTAISAICEQATSTVHASDAMSRPGDETLLSRYCDTIETLISLKKRQA